MQEVPVVANVECRGVLLAAALLAFDGTTFAQAVQSGDERQIASSAQEPPAPVTPPHAAALLETGRVRRVLEGGALQGAGECGSTWASAGGLPPAVTLSDVAWTGSQLVAVGSDGATSNWILTSQNGISWAQRTPPGYSWPRAVASNGAKVVAVGRLGTIITSSDGKTWGWTGVGDADLYAVAWTGSRFVTVGDAGAVVTSDGGAVLWTAQGPAGSPPPRLHGVASSGSLVVAVGAGGAVLTSAETPRYEWTARATGTGTDLMAAVWGLSQFVVVGKGGTILTSPDGVTWTARTSGTVSDLLAVTSTDAELVVCGDGGTVLASPDGVTWTSLGGPASFSGIAWTGAKLVAASSDALFTSTCPRCSRPSVTAQPQGEAIRSGQTATLTVGATGPAEPGYHWYQGASGDVSRPVGGDSFSFTTPPLAVTTSYWVRVSLTCGSVDSAAAIVRVTNATQRRLARHLERVP
jgi:hypothetical protein